jgi:hypothetical protein
MNAYLERRAEVLHLAAEKAFQTPLLTSGFWRHEDLRDNVYLALHGMVHLYEYNPKRFNRMAEFKRCENVLHQALQLQNIDSNCEMYGHWPLRLADNPADSEWNILPVELMGCLLILFAEKYPAILTDGLTTKLRASIQHIYLSKFYIQPLTHFGHHEAKHTAMKLLLGHIYSDHELLNRGHADLKQLIAHLHKNGFREYGALPWFWHWVQAFICAWEVVKVDEINTSLEEMLDVLWRERGLFYLQGAWAGPHSRALEHDVPEDQNVLHDYIQFGDFKLPNAIPRLEGAGLHHYHISEARRSLAIENKHAAELKKKIILSADSSDSPKALHTYLYKTQDYAIGGMWERTEEYMNEQHRWDITLPLRDGGNQAYFFLPILDSSEGDARHAHVNGGHILFHKNAVVLAYPAAKIDEAVKAQTLVGFLPSGAWTFDETSGYGSIDNVYICFHLLQPFKVRETENGMLVTSEGLTQAVAMEVLSVEEASALDITSFEKFKKAAAAAELRDLSTINAANLEKETLSGTKLKLTWDATGNLKNRTVNERAVVFEDYSVHPFET